MCLGLTNDLNWVLRAESHKLDKANGDFLGLLLDLVEMYSTKECDFEGYPKKFVVKNNGEEKIFESLSPNFDPENWINQISNDPLKPSQMKIMTTKTVFEAHIQSGPCTYFIRGEPEPIPPPVRVTMIF